MYRYGYRPFPRHSFEITMLRFMIKVYILVHVHCIYHQVLILSRTCAISEAKQEDEPNNICVHVHAYLAPQTIIIGSDIAGIYITSKVQYKLEETDVGSN